MFGSDVHVWLRLGLQEVKAVMLVAVSKKEKAGFGRVQMVIMMIMMMMMTLKMIMLQPRVA